MLDAYASLLNETIIRVYDSIMRLEEQMLARSVKNLTISELHILEAIGKMNGEPCTISDLAQARQVSLPSMTVAVQKLEKKGLVEKRRGPQDGRVVQVSLTRNGHKYYAMHAYFHERMVRSLLRNIPEQQRPALLQAMQDIDLFLKRQLAGMNGGEDQQA
ncbi:MAG: MarR family transcriptional regulator [Firmicutes bacterium]|nr:MarR family transcriptional regulator [Bacillota bacterium]